MNGEHRSRGLSQLISSLGQRMSRGADRAVEPPPAAVTEPEPVVGSKALQKFLCAARSRPTLVVLDLGPAVGSNITFLAQETDCKIHVEDLYADLDRHVQQGILDRLPAFLGTRFRLPDESVDAVLCWDLVDYLDGAAATVLAHQLTRVLRPEGTLLGFFGTVAAREMRYTKYIIVDEQHLRHRHYPAACRRQRVLENREIIKLFDHLHVADSFLLRSNVREILFRKPPGNGLTVA